MESAGAMPKRKPVKFLKKTEPANEPVPAQSSAFRGGWRQRQIVKSRVLACVNFFWQGCDMC